MPLTEVPGPTPSVREFGLMSVVQSRFDDADPHWRGGVKWEAVCGAAGTAFQDCGDDTGERDKDPTHDIEWYGAQPFTVYSRVDCTPIGFGQSDVDGGAKVTTTLERYESFQVEQAFWTGTVDAAANRAVPHLAASAEILDTEESASGVPVILQMAATQVTGVALDIAEALGRLEQATSGCGDIQRTIHMTQTVAEIAASRGLLEARNGQLRTKLGSLVAAGLGYTGSSPSGVLTAGVHWMYATGPVFMYRTPLIRVGADIREVLDRATDTVIAIAERTYLLGYDCCLQAIPVSLGGEISGAFNSAT